MNTTNVYDLPDPIVQAIVNDPYNSGADISATGMIRPPRMRVLEKRHAQEITSDVSDKLWILLGQAVHNILERGDTPGYRKEERLFAEVLGWKISGKYDALRIVGSKLIDYKVTSVWAFLMGDKPEWTQQLNILAWLLTEYGHSINDLEINAILRDHSKRRVSEDNYPPVPFQKVKIPLWTREKQTAYIQSRVKAHQESEKLPTDQLPPCTDDERWAKPDTWAVIKKGNKRAKRVFNSEEEAIKANEVLGLSIEHRRGDQFVRCRSYCDVSKFCNQFKESK